MILKILKHNPPCSITFKSIFKKIVKGVVLPLENTYFYVFKFVKKTSYMKAQLTISFFLLHFLLHAQKNIHHRWNNQLQKYVADTGQVNYNAWQKDREHLDAYILTLAQFPPEESASKNHKLSYWINTYNALTVQLILNHYPLKSIKEIKAPWDAPCFTAEGKKFSLGDIEHKILRKMGEARIHFAINCASASCPKLFNYAFEEKKLEQQLEKVTRDFINDPSKNKITESQVELSKIFLWFGKDFGSKSERMAFLERYSGIVLSRPKIHYLVYDWSLNE